MSYYCRYVKLRSKEEASWVFFLISGIYAKFNRLLSFKRACVENETAILLIICMMNVYLNRYEYNDRGLHDKTSDEYTRTIRKNVDRKQN